MTLSSAQVHDRLLAAWQRAPLYCNVRLVARFADPSVGNPDASSAYVLVPDLHLISDERLHAFSYGTNHWETLYASLFRLALVRNDLSAEGVRLQVLHMGDLFDLWRDGHSQNRDSVQHIVASWGNLLKLLYRAPNDPHCLRAQLLVGNHDVQMAGTPGWALRCFLPDESPQAFALALHGDWFDPSERLPDWLSRAGLAIAGRLPQAHTYPVNELLPLLAQRSAEANHFQDWIQLPAPANVDATGVPGDTAALPDEHNVMRKSRGQAHPFLHDVVALVRRYRGDPNASVGFTGLRLVAIGHTHHPRISVDDTIDPPLTLLDTGAWIEKYRDATGSVRPNGQLSVICGNDVRIYQFDQR